MSELGNKEIMARNIQYYMNRTGKSRSEVCKDLQVSYTTFRDWIKGNTYPRIDKIELMANYFGITKSDLVEERPGTQTDTGLSEKDTKLLEWFHSLPPEKRKAILALGDAPEDLDIE